MFKFHKIFSFLYAIVLLLLINSCAQVVRPSGGEQDRKPPQILKISPENKSLNFKGNTISIVFDEYFKIVDASNQWLISPPLKYTPEYKIKGKTLIVSFKDTLKENATYSFYFGKSIIDNNEGNVLQNFNYIFSTGNHLDSLQLKGNVKSALLEKTEKDVLVMLYEEKRCKSDSFPYKILPDYFGFSDGAGNYQVSYIKPGKYNVIALKDANNNFLFDHFEEAIDMSDSLINLHSNQTLNFDIFTEIESKTYLKSKSNSEYGSFNLIFNKALPHLEIELLNKQMKKDWAIFENSKNNDTVNFWLSDFSADTLKLVLKDNGIAFDTAVFPVYSQEKFKSRSNRIIPAITTIKIIPANDAVKEYNKAVVIRTNHPIAHITNDSIKLFEGQKIINYTLLATDSARRNFELTASFNNDSTYKLIIGKGAFTDCLGYKNDSTGSKFKAASAESIGNLYINIIADSTKEKINFYKENLLLQLLSEKDEVLNTQKIDNYRPYIYLNYKPGNYKMRIVIDRNNNGQWDTGNFLKKIKPETVIYFGVHLNLRANWDLEEDWVLILPEK